MSTLALHRSREFRASTGKLSYLVYQPPGWSEEPRPLVLFLHGAGQRGHDLSQVAAHGIPSEIERGKNLPFVSVSPQCPSAMTWVDLTDTLSALLDELVPTLGIDERRIYLTGMSMGAFGAWKLAAQTPQRFAALVPVCGGGDPSWAPRLRSLPTWAFHGALDDIVPLHHTQRMVEALEAVGAPIKLTVYPDLAHDSWSRTYADASLYEWLLGQRRSERSESGHATAEHGY